MQNGQGQANLKSIGRTPRGVQRYQCKTCGKTFTETKGAIFYRKHAQEYEILEVLALLAEGIRISTLTRVKGIKEDTILRWLRETARYTEQIEEVLLKVGTQIAIAGDLVFKRAFVVEGMLLTQKQYQHLHQALHCRSYRVR